MDAVLLEEIEEKVDKILLRLRAGMELKKDIMANIDSLLVSQSKVLVHARYIF
jgi:hypothetical protein